MAEKTFEQVYNDHKIDLLSHEQFRVFINLLFLSAEQSPKSLEPQPVTMKTRYLLAVHVAQFHGKVDVALLDYTLRLLVFLGVCQVQPLTGDEEAPITVSFCGPPQRVDRTPEKVRSAGAIRQARYRARQKARSSNEEQLAITSPATSNLA